MGRIGLDISTGNGELAYGVKIDVIHNGLDHSYFYPHTEFEDESVSIYPFSIKRF